MAGTRPKLAVRTPEGLWIGGFGHRIHNKIGGSDPCQRESHHACASTASLLLASGVPPECANNSSVLYMFCVSFVLFVCVLNQRGVVVVVVV